MTASINLDDPAIPRDEISIYNDPARVPPRMVFLTLGRILLEALNLNVAVLHFFLDHPGESLRIMSFLPAESGDRPSEAVEFAPAPWCIAGHILKKLRAHTSWNDSGTEGTLHYRYGKQERQAFVEMPLPFDLRVYFSDARPPLRFKPDAYDVNDTKVVACPKCKERIWYRARTCAYCGAPVEEK